MRLSHQHAIASNAACAPAPAPAPAPRSRRRERHLDDRQLIARALEGDEQAFETVVRRHYTALCQHVRRVVGCPSVAEDLVLELFSHLWERGHRATPATPATRAAPGTTTAPGSPTTIDRGYLYRAAKNRALDYLRRQRAATLWIDRISREVDRTGSPSDPLEWRELAAAAGRAVAELPQQQRRIFVLCRYHEMSYRDVAACLGISPRTVNTQLTRALKGLRRKLAGYLAVAALVVTSTAAIRGFLP